MSFIRENQLDIMLVLIGICVILALAILLTKSISGKRRNVLAVMAVASAMILAFERCAYMFRGDVSDLGFYMVRISNGLVFFFLLFIPFLVNQYLKDLYKNEGGVEKPSIPLKIADVVFVIGTALLIISQFTGLYYTFDAQNVYQRSMTFVLVYIPPILMVMLQMVSLIKHQSNLPKALSLSLLASLILPVIASLIQLFAYGISFSVMVTASVIVIYYSYMIYDLNKTASKAKDQEIEFYKEAKKMQTSMFEQTVEALVSAIDAKDIRTRGHSARVAMYARKIGEKAGLSEEECEDLYFAALLHDAGKIGIPELILNKPEKLTDEEYETVKSHTVMGDQILSKIKLAPYLSVGARSHHERYDGTGYPDGLAGEDIPEIARIIAVADAYDVMTSKRTYHDPMPTSAVRQEVVDGKGTQFDPRFADIMLEMIDDWALLQTNMEDGTK